jgi:hypothetical protein
LDEKISRGRKSHCNPEDRGAEAGRNPEIFPTRRRASIRAGRILQIFLRMFFPPGLFLERVARVEPAVVPEKTSLPAD